MREKDKLISALTLSQENWVTRDYIWLFEQYVLWDSVKAFQGFKLPVYIILVQDSSGRDREARTKIASVSLCVCEYVIECVWLRLKTLKKTFPPASSSSVCHFQADQKTEDILSKAGFTGFYVFFLRPDSPRESALSSTGLHPPPALFQA